MTFTAIDFETATGHPESACILTEENKNIQSPIPIFRAD